VKSRFDRVPRTIQRSPQFMNYAKALRIARAIKGVQQKDLAVEAGLDTSYVSLLEQGKRKPSLKTIRSLSEALNIPTELFTLLATEADDLTLTDPSELENVGISLARLLVPHAVTVDD